MLNQNEIKRLKEWCNKRFFEPNSLAIDSFDFEAEIDVRLTYHENKALLREKLQTFFKEPPTKNEIKTQTEKAESEDFKEVKKQEEEFNKSFEMSVYELKEKPQTITSKYSIPIDYIKSVARGFNKSFVFLGGSGIGKSFTVRQTLSKEGVKFIESRGVNSPLALYNLLYENNKEDLIIVFDDVAQLINSENSYSILLGILWEGVAQWNSTTEKLKIPKYFIFKGKIIIIANRLSGFNAEIIKSRCLVYNLEMNQNDIIKMMYEIAKIEHDKLTKEERFKIVDFIKSNSSNSVTNLDLRIQHKAEQLYLYSPQKWESLVKALFDFNNEIEIVEYCLKSSNTVREAERKFNEETGLSRASFWRYKSKISCLT